MGGRRGGLGVLDVIFTFLSASCSFGGLADSEEGRMGRHRNGLLGFEGRLCLGTGGNVAACELGRGG